MVIEEASGSSFIRIGGELHCKHECSTSRVILARCLTIVQECVGVLGRELPLIGSPVICSVIALSGSVTIWKGGDECVAGCGSRADRSLITKIDV